MIVIVNIDFLHAVYSQYPIIGFFAFDVSNIFLGKGKICSLKAAAIEYDMV